MTYATQPQMTDRFGSAELIQLTDRATPPAGAIDVAVLGEALEGADGVIDGYVSTRYPVPLSPVPLLIVDLACDIARYRLYTSSAPEVVVERYRNAVRMLEAISKGTLKLGVDAAGGEPPPSNVVQFTTGQKVFAREESGGDE